jgi:hypothetical protein
MKNYHLVRFDYFTALFLFCYSIVFISCNNKGNNNEHQTANPFDTTQTTAQTLSEEDRTKLINAQGKKAMFVNNDFLANKIANSTGALHAFCFFQIENVESVKAVKAVNDLASQYDSTRLKVTFIHISKSQSMDNINLFIRENQLIGDCFILDDLDKNLMANKVKKDFMTADQLPIVVLINKAEDMFFYYNKSFEESEIKAIIQPLIQ